MSLLTLYLIVSHFSQGQDFCFTRDSLLNYTSLLCVFGYASLLMPFFVNYVNINRLKVWIRGKGNPDICFLLGHVTFDAVNHVLVGVLCMNFSHFISLRALCELHCSFRNANVDVCWVFLAVTHII